MIEAQDGTIYDTAGCRFSIRALRKQPGTDGPAGSIFLEPHGHAHGDDADCRSLLFTGGLHAARQMWADFRRDCMRGEPAFSFAPKRTTGNGNGGNR